MSKDQRQGLGAQLREPPKTETKDDSSSSTAGKDDAPATSPGALAAAPGPGLKPDEPTEPATAAPQDVRAVSHYVIAKRKSITSIRGMLKEGDRVEARDFPGGQASFDEHVAADRIVPVFAEKT